MSVLNVYTVRDSNLLDKKLLWSGHTCFVPTVKINGIWPLSQSLIIIGAV